MRVQRLDSRDSYRRCRQAKLDNMACISVSFPSGQHSSPATEVGHRANLINSVTPQFEGTGEAVNLESGPADPLLSFRYHPLKSP